MTGIMIIGNGRRRMDLVWDTQDMSGERTQRGSHKEAMQYICWCPASSVLLTDHTKIHRHSVLQSSDSSNNIKIYL